MKQKRKLIIGIVTALSLVFVIVSGALAVSANQERQPIQYYTKVGYVDAKDYASVEEMIEQVSQNMRDEFALHISDHTHDCECLGTESFTENGSLRVVGYLDANDYASVEEMKQHALQALNEALNYMSEDAVFDVSIINETSVEALSDIPKCTNIFGHTWKHLSTDIGPQYHHCSYCSYNYTNGVRPKCLVTYTGWYECTRTFCTVVRYEAITYNMNCIPVCH